MIVSEVLSRLVVTYAEFQAEGRKRVGASIGNVAFSCVGRWARGAHVRRAFGENGAGPCDYAGGGLLGLNPVEVVFVGPDGIVSVRSQFRFAGEEWKPATEETDMGPRSKLLSSVGRAWVDSASGEPRDYVRAEECES